MRRAAIAAPAGEHLQSCVGESGLLRAVQPAPEIVVFSGRLIGPASREDVRVGSDAEMVTVQPALEREKLAMGVAAPLAEGAVRVGST